MESPPEPPPWAARFFVFFWSGLSFFAVVYVWIAESAALRGAAALVALCSLAGALASWRHQRGRARLALHPVYSQVLTAVALVSLLVISSDLVWMRWLWALVVPLAAVALLGEYRRRNGRPFAWDRWIAERLTARQWTTIVLVVTALGLVALAVWVYVSRDAWLLVVPAGALLALLIAYRASLRHLDSSSGGSSNM